MVRAWWLALALLCLALPATTAAEIAWVKDELRLNLRTGPGTQYRIKGAVGTGDRMTVLSRGDGWTQVSTPSLGEGWIPAGFLQAEPPAGVRLAEYEAQTAEFRSKYESVASRTSELEATNAELADNDAAQKARIEQLSRENFELRAGARWPEWITGAGILLAGMLMGAILHSVSGRRQRPRIRL
ncbi:MAG: TIGR04211 family SH3 domain-containing protein [Myxococcota bacterium]